MLKVIVIRYSFVIRSLLWLIRFAVGQLNEDISTLQKLPADLRQTEAARSGLSAPLSERRGAQKHQYLLQRPLEQIFQAATP